jgi:hypothetical protein
MASIRWEGPVQVLLLVLVVVIALVVIGAVISALKWLLFLGAAIFVIGLFTGWWRRT